MDYSSLEAAKYIFYSVAGKAQREHFLLLAQKVKLSAEVELWDISFYFHILLFIWFDLFWFLCLMAYQTLWVI